MGRKIELRIEIVSEAALVGEALPALEAAKERGEGGPLVLAARRALPLLLARRPEGPVHSPDVFAWKLAVGRLEAVVATDPEPPQSAAAFEEVAWALLRAARQAEPVSLGEDWDLLRVLTDPARRRSRGLGVLGGTLAGAALAGSGPLASASGFALVREGSYATGWNGEERVRRIARSLRRFDETKLEAAARATPPEVARTVWPHRPAPLVNRLPRAIAALEKLKAAYFVAARERAGVFLELLLD